MKNVNLPLQIACEKIQELMSQMAENQKIRGEIHRCTSFQAVIDVLSRKRADVTVILSDEINEEENLLAQIKDILNEKNEITVATLSLATR